MFKHNPVELVEPKWSIPEWEGLSGSDRDYVELHSIRFQMTLSLLSNVLTPGMRVGNIGLSPFDLLALRTLDSVDYRAVLPSKQFLSRFSAEAYKRVPLEFYDVTTVGGPPIEPFDVILLAEVLEHLWAPDRVVIDRIREILRPGGRLVMTVPNAAKHVSRLRLLVGKNVFWSKEDMIHGVQFGFGHIREYTLSEIRNILVPRFVLENLGTFEPYGNKWQRRLGRILPPSLRSVIYAIASSKSGRQ